AGTAPVPSLRDLHPAREQLIELGAGAAVVLARHAQRGEIPFGRIVLHRGGELGEPLFEDRDLRLERLLCLAALSPFPLGPVTLRALAGARFLRGSGRGGARGPLRRRRGRR